MQPPVVPHTRLARVVLALLATLVGISLLAPAALAAPGPPQLTLARADAVALSVLHPQSAGSQVVVFGAREPLAAADVVTEAGPSLRHGRSRLFPHGIGHRAWMFWEDLAFNSPFVHPSRVLLIDAASGAVLKLAALNYFPLVDGRAPPYLEWHGPFEKKYQLYASPLLRGAPSLRARSVHPVASTATVPVLPPGTFAGDCAIMVGKYTPDGYDDDRFSRDFNTLARFLSIHGIATYWSVQQGLPTTTKPSTAQTVTGTTFGADINWLISHKNCKDVFIYLAGHGNPKVNKETGDPWPGPYSVTTGPGFAGGVSAPDIARIVASHPRTTFKLKVNSCYSGRMLDPQYGLTNLKNLLVIETSNSDTEYGSWEIETTTGKPVPDRLIPNPDKVSEFMNQDLYGMTVFLQSQDEVNLALAAGGSFFAHMLAWSFTLGAQADQARYTPDYHNGGVAHPQLYTNFHPSIASVTPASGPSGGGTVVTIEGTNFLPGTTVTIGGKPATDVTVMDVGTITAKTPPGTAGTRVDVTVSNPGGHSATATGAFIYVPSGLAFASQPSNTVAGATIAPPVTVRITDDSGNTVTAANGPVSVTLGPNAGGATLSGTTTVNAVNGVATFSDLSVPQPGTYTLQASSTGLPTLTSNPFTVGPPTLPAPTGLKATATGSSTIGLAWNPVDGATSYTIARSTDNTNFMPVGTTTGTSFTDTGLMEDTTYYYEVQAVNDSTTATYSSSVNATTEESGPGIQLIPTSGPPGGSFTVKGTGFAPNSTVTILFDTAAIGTAAVDSSGNFNVTETVPSTASQGMHVVSAGGNATAEFTVT